MRTMRVRTKTIGVSQHPSEKIIELVTIHGPEQLIASDMPKWYLPSAIGGIMAGEDLLLRAGYRPGSRRPSGWHPYLRDPKGAFKRLLKGNQVLFVRRNGNRNLWSIERSVYDTPEMDRLSIDEALVLRFGPRLVFTRSCQSAMFLGDYCHSAPPELPELIWADTNYIVSLAKAA